MQNFVIERLIEEDLPFLLEVRNDCRQMLHDNRDFTLEECRAWFHECQPEFYPIRYRGERIGYFRVSNRRSEKRSAYVGADLHGAVRGKGLSRSAYQASLEILNGEGQVDVAYLEVLSHNTLAIRFYQKLGFTEIERQQGVAERMARWSTAS